MSVESLLDRQNLSLLEELRQTYEIDFEAKEIDYFECFTQNNQAVIHYNPNRFDNPSIAHELLHIWLKKFNYCVGNHIYLICASDKKLSQIFNKFLCDYVENCFDHFKMYPKYLEMGYSPSDFIENANEEKCSIDEINQLKLNFLDSYKASAINRYIGYLISIYADHVPNEYSEHLALMKKKNAELFDIVTNFWNKWVAFDITTIDPIYNSDMDLLDSFIDDMRTWSQYKKVK